MTRSRRVLEALVSGCIVYGLMAACSSSSMKVVSTGTTSGHTSSAGSGGHEGMGGHTGAGGMMGAGGKLGSGGTTGTGDDSGIIDALMDPTAEAMAGVENPQSGTRLKGKFTMSSDGAKQYQLTTNEVDIQDYPPYQGNNYAHGRGVQPVWYDSLLMSDCVFYTAADGMLRCLPGHAVVPGESYGVLYSDSQCSTPVLAMTATSFGCSPYPVPTYLLNSPPQIQPTCPATTTATPPVHVYKIGAAVMPAPPQLYTINGNGSGGLSCGEINGLQPTTFYALTEVAASTFVAGTTGIDP